MSTTTRRSGSTRRWRETRARILRMLPCPCGICGQPFVDPRQCDIDHVLPVALGGTDDLANLRLTHSHCNRGRRVTRVEREPTHWRSAYPGHWPPDPEPANTVIDWSRHWWTTGEFNPRCPTCRELGRACPDARDDAA